MARRISETLRKLGSKPTDDEAVSQPGTRRRPDAERDNDETDHDRYRRRQQRLAEQDTASSLPIEYVEHKEVGPRPGSQFEGPIEKLIEKYKDPREVVRHMSVGQYMRYELRGGEIWQGDTLLYDGTQHMQGPQEA